jgi:CheY-like chemotaxis protein
MCNGDFSEMIHMAYVTPNAEETAPTVLIVDNNPMSLMRLQEIFKIREFNVEVCEDGDQAVDEYIRIDPELVVIALDLPSLDGHLAALEMREHGGESRIVFIASRRLAQLAEDASHSAGAVAWLEKPISFAAIEERWEQILGPIPDAPGLEDLDQLYPEDRIKPQADEGILHLPPLPGMPAIPLPGVINDPLLSFPGVTLVADAVKKPKRRIFKLMVVLILAGAGYLVYAKVSGIAPFV